MSDYAKLIYNLAKTQPEQSQSEFFKFVIDDLSDRLNSLSYNGGKALVINMIADFYTESVLSKILGAYPEKTNIDAFLKAPKILSDQNKFDLIIFPFGLHWISDVQMFLLKIRNYLTDKGLFVANFASSGSLMNLRKLFIALEDQYTHKYSVHIAPFIAFEQLPPLLTQAGFKEQVADFENVEIEYGSPLALIKAIKQHGHSNILQQQKDFYCITKSMYHALGQDNIENGHFYDKITLSTIIAAPQKGSIKIKDGLFF